MSHPQHTPDQPIPLQDLAPDHAVRPHRRTLSDRGRNLLRQTGPYHAAQDAPHAQYAPLVEASPSPTRHPAPRLDTRLAAAVTDDDATSSPLDTGAFQAAIGFGLATPGPETWPPGSYANGPVAADDDDGYFSPIDVDGDDDTTRLTDGHHLQPISGAAAAAASSTSVRFLSPADASPTAARASHDLALAEAAAVTPSSRGRKRSLSPATLESPLHRAGTMVRNMSQRVVNVTNDAHVAERTLARKSTLPSPRPVEPDTGPAAAPEYATDGPASPREKPPSPSPSLSPSPSMRHTSPSAPPWMRPSNPLRGKSLGLFGPDSTLRTRLCHVLVHPATEPLLLVLIVIQTVLLAVDARTKAVYQPARHKPITEFGPIDCVLLGLFIIYTLEAAVRIIVSGFFFNPVEYSTINRQVGLREAVLIKCNHLFGGPQRQPSQRRNGTTTDPALGPHQPSVMRTFTTAQIHPDAGIDDPRHQQRVRLAHRAYLRHSFNRTDFVAVVSYWIAFVLGLFDINNSRVILVFRMLSCLRIIRLLNLTSGTSVGHGRNSATPPFLH